MMRNQKPFYIFRIRQYRRDLSTIVIRNLWHQPKITISVHWPFFPTATATPSDLQLSWMIMIRKSRTLVDGSKSRSSDCHARFHNVSAYRCWRLFHPYSILRNRNEPNNWRNIPRKQTLSASSAILIERRFDDILNIVSVILVRRLSLGDVIDTSSPMECIRHRSDWSPTWLDRIMFRHDRFLPNRVARSIHSTTNLGFR